MKDILIDIQVPDLLYSFKSGNIDYSAPATKTANVNMLKSIKSNFGGLISLNSQLFEIPEGFIAAFIATESGGKNVAPNRYEATGLMQATPAAFYDSFNYRLKNEDVSAADLAMVRKYVPLTVTGNKINQNFAILKPAILKALNVNEFNIYAGCLLLDFLIDRFAVGGKAQINKVLIGYNAGAYQRVITAQKAVVVDTASLVKNTAIPQESRWYLEKMLGKDGFMDLIYRQRLVTFSS